MTCRKRLPIGLSGFRELREKNYYFVDKSLLIAELLATGSKVTLLTRPRRFGKTLNMTMLREFFSMDVDSKEIFSGLKIMETNYSTEINKYPVLFFSFKDVKGSKADIITGIKTELMREFERYSFIEKFLSENKRIIFTNITKALFSYAYDDLDKINNCIRFLTEIVCEHFKVCPVLLIDEYDTPIISSYENNLYDEFRNFFTNLYSSGLKDNASLNFAVLTGIQRVAKENIFSGLNNLKVCTVMDAKYSDKFGLTVEETGELLQYYDLELNEAVAKMYNGYNFAGTEIFNPWSIINYADEKLLKSYWVNTSSNSLIRRLITEVDFNFANIFEELLQTERIHVPINLATTFFEMRNAANFWGLFVNTGYLTLAKNMATEDDIATLRIPNGEVKRDFRSIVANYLGMDPSLPEAMFGYLLIGDVKNFQATYQELLLNCTSFYDLKENAYHMLFLGMSFYLEKKYIIKSNIEAGHGRADIIYTAKQKGDPNLIVEFKQGENTELLAKEALAQIKAREYYAGLQGITLLVGVAHFKKKIKVLTEKIVNT